MSAKITSGKWDLGDENNQCCSVLIGEKHNLTCWFSRQDENTGEFVIERDEMLANAHLLIDAGNVANKTGLTPRQLAVRITVLEAQSAELLAALTHYLHVMTTAGGGDKQLFMAAIREADDKARAAIVKATGSA